MYIQVFSFSKARDIIQKFWMSETTQRNTLQKHLKSGICWKVKHIIQLSRILQGEVIQVFFYSNTYNDCLVAEFPVLEHLCSISL